MSLLATAAGGLLLAAAALLWMGDRLVPCADVSGLDALITDGPADGGTVRAHCTVPTASAWGFAVVAGVAPLVGAGAYWAARGRIRDASAPAVAAVLLLLGWVSFTDPEYRFGCADVGLRGPSGETPQQALERFMAEEGGDPRNWAFTGESYVPVTDDAEPSRYRVIGVHESTAGVWMVGGACV